MIIATGIYIDQDSYGIGLYNGELFNWNELRLATEKQRIAWFTRKIFGEWKRSPISKALSVFYFFYLYLYIYISTRICAFSSTVIDNCSESVIRIECNP